MRVDGRVHGGRGGLRAAVRGRADRGDDAVLAEAPAVDPARVLDPVGAQDEQVARAQLELDLLELRVGLDAEQRPVHHDLLRLARARAHEQRIRVAAGGEADREAVAAALERRAADGDERGVGRLAPQRLVEEDEHRLRAVLARGDRAQRVAREAGQRRRRAALAGDVADGDQPALRAGLEEVVEVAADLAAVGDRVVADGDLEPGRLVEPLGQQSGLQRPRHVGALLVEPRAVERRRREVRERQQEVPLARVERARRDERQRDRPEHAVGRDQRHDGERLEALDRRGQRRPLRPVLAALEPDRGGADQRQAQRVAPVDREAPPAVRHSGLVAVVVDEDDLAVVDQPERAAVGAERLHGLGDGGLADVGGGERAGQRGRRALQQREALDHDLGLVAALDQPRDVDRVDHRADDLAVAVTQRDVGEVEVQRAPLAGDRVGGHAAPLLAGDRVARRVDAAQGVDHPAVLRLGEDLGDRTAEELAVAGERRVQRVGVADDEVRPGEDADRRGQLIEHVRVEQRGPV